MTDTRIIELPDLNATRRFGHALGAALFPGAVVALVGSLGAGKTHLVRAIAEGLGIRDPRQVTSPTFVLLQEYAARLPIYHFDLYRLVDAVAFEDLGAGEFLEGRGVCLIEWADRAKPCLPDDHLLITLQITGEQSRQAELIARGSQHAALLRAIDGL